MAKQHGIMPLSGTINDITYFRLNGKFYARAKTSLTKKRVKNDPKFKKSMECANKFGIASSLASQVYRELPKNQQIYKLFTALLKRSQKMIMADKTVKETMVALQQLSSEFLLKQTRKQQINKPVNFNTDFSGTNKPTNQ